MITINPTLCKSCMYCVKFCPKQILAQGKTRTKAGFFIPELTDESKCISCAICAVSCPEGAITVTK